MATPASNVTAFLMTEKGFEFLKHALVKHKSIFELIVVGSDKSVAKDYEQEIIELCEAQNVPVVRRADHKEVTSEYVIAISWRWLIRHPAEKLIVFHDSLLPKYRGFAPLVNALINGESEVGVTAIFGATQFDTGDIISQARAQITYPIKIKDAISIVNQCYLDAAELVLDSLLNNIEIEATPQDNDAATYSVWRDELDYQIEWSDSAVQIRRLIDSVGHPYKGAYTKLDNKIFRILDAIEVEDVVIENRHCGKVLFFEEGKPIVICGQGLLKILDATIEDENGTVSAFPLNKFRLRFSS